MNACCPRYVCVPTHGYAGLGHRITNILQGLILSDGLHLPYALTSLEHGGVHGPYQGADELFAQVDSPGGVVLCPAYYESNNPQYGDAQGLNSTGLPSPPWHVHRLELIPGPSVDGLPSSARWALPRVGRGRGSIRISLFSSI